MIVVIGETLLQAKEQLEPLETGSGREGFFPSTSRESIALLIPWFWTSGLSTVVSVVTGYCNPRKLIQITKLDDKTNGSGLQRNCPALLWDNFWRRATRRGVNFPPGEGDSGNPETNKDAALSAVVESINTCKRYCQLSVSVQLVPWLEWSCSGVMGRAIADFGENGRPEHWWASPGLGLSVKHAPSYDKQNHAARGTVRVLWVHR